MQLAEHVVVPDVFVTGLARVERVGGGCLRFTFFTRQRSVIFTDGRAELIVTARIVIPVTATCSAAKIALMASLGVGGVIDDVMVDPEH